MGEEGGRSSKEFTGSGTWQERGGYFSVAICGVHQRTLCSCLDIYANVVSENKQTSMPTLLVKTNQTKTSFVPVASFPNILLGLKPSLKCDLKCSLPVLYNCMHLSLYIYNWA